MPTSHCAICPAAAHGTSQDAPSESPSIAVLMGRRAIRTGSPLGVALLRRRNTNGVCRVDRWRRSAVLFAKASGGGEHPADYGMVWRESERSWT